MVGAERRLESNGDRWRDKVLVRSGCMAAWPLAMAANHNRGIARIAEDMALAVGERVRVGEHVEQPYMAAAA